ncbi:(deoxy)nucleoside triphosphate pyrophosphohydrolase [Pontibacter arcticus]|uniref:8-oxo-dGTP diphosphatase n=1 Tax=Pontibacter arcticus TaxID=2080288 RepID=A0A364RG09_9BACT|nr:(deoxy)nucleoside triphosphate pyrophosphohydrolase [Pontibacter arcticus]RAU83214.1 8-oxo-dGTP diphosphatase MutT [Pontibacter arcticus]
MIKVTCAIIEQQGRVLVTQRSGKMSQPFLWEYPGGKLEPNETEEAALVREIKEELNIAIEPVFRLTSVIHTFPDNLVIELIPFICRYKGGNVSLTEHRSYQWSTLSDLKKYDWCPADIPVLNEYLELKQHTNA